MLRTGIVNFGRAFGRGDRQKSAGIGQGHPRAYAGMIRERAAIDDHLTLSTAGNQEERMREIGRLVMLKTLSLLPTQEAIYRQAREPD